MNPEASPQHYRWVVLILLFLAATLNYADRTAFSANFPLLKKDFGMSDTQLGAIGTLFLWSYALMSPLAGAVGDRFSRASLVTGSLFGWSLVTGVTGLVTSVHQLFGMRILLGISESLYLPAAMALIAQHFTSSGRGRALCVHVVGLQLGFVLGGYVAGFLGERFGWRAPLFVLSATGLVLAGVCYFMLREKPAASAEVRVEIQEPPVSWFDGFRALVQVPSFLFLALEAMLTSIGAWIFAYWLPFYYQETFHMKLGESGLYGTAALASGTWLGIIGGGWLSDRVTRRFGARNRMLTELCCYALAAPFLLCFIVYPTVTSVTTAVFGFGLLLSLGAANSPPLWFDVLEKRIWARAVGFMNTANGLIGGLGVYAAGFFKARLGLKNVFAGVSVIMILTSCLLVICYLVFLQKDLARRGPSRAENLA